jgi:hypothetical protein
LENAGTRSLQRRRGGSPFALKARQRRADPAAQGGRLRVPRSFRTRRSERLLWRAGFGPRPGEAERLAGKGLDAAVRLLTSPGRERLRGPKPRDEKGRPLAPRDAWGHDHLWWLDRMVRTSRPLVERMTLIWHDWFATSNDGADSQRLMLEQNALFRRNALGSFRDLLLQVTHDRAMLLWLNGVENEKEAPNENYAREMMELFTLGAGRGYGERDVREQARALTGWGRELRALAAALVPLLLATLYFTYGRGAWLALGVEPLPSVATSCLTATAGGPRLMAPGYAGLLF